MNAQRVHDLFAGRTTPTEQLAIGKAMKKAIMYMVTPYMDHDLLGLLANPDVHFSEAQIKCYMLQLLEGVRYLHDVCYHPAVSAASVKTDPALESHSPP